MDRASEIKQPKRRDNLIDHAEMARISKILVTLKQDVDVSQPLSTLKLEKADPLKVLEFLRAQGFKRLIARFEAEAQQEFGDELSLSNPADKIEKKYELVDNLKSLIDWGSTDREKWFSRFRYRNRLSKCLASQFNWNIFSGFGWKSMLHTITARKRG